MTEFESPVITATDEAAREKTKDELSVLSVADKRKVTIDGIIAGLVSNGATEDAAKIMAPDMLQKVKASADIDGAAKAKFHKA